MKGKKGSDLGSDLIIMKFYSLQVEQVGNIGPEAHVQGGRDTA